MALKTLYSPVALFCYNRLDKLQTTVHHLLKNVDSENTRLYIFCDGPKHDEDQKSVQSVKDYVNKIEGFHSLNINVNHVNQGLANSIISGVEYVLNQHDSVIVIEDDLVTSPFFLQFMNDALYLYRNQQQVGSISGHVYPVKSTLPETFFIKEANCWGWATWKRAWKAFNPNSIELINSLEKLGLINEFNRLYPDKRLSRMLEEQLHSKIDSWAIRWIASSFLENMYTLYPSRSLVKNIGLDGSGTHGDHFDDPMTLTNNRIKVSQHPICELEEAKLAFQNYFNNGNSKNIFSKIKKRIRSCFHY